MLNLCPMFAGAGGAYAEDGTIRHHCISEFLQGDLQAFDNFDPEQKEGLFWAANYIKLHAPMADHPLECEKTRTITCPDKTVIKGTPDITCGKHLFDVKWRYRNYRAQMACYAMMQMQENNLPEVTSHLLFAAPGYQKPITETWTMESAWNCISPILDTVRNPQAKPNPNEFCNWCQHIKTCPAMIERINAVLLGREDWRLEQYHASELKSGEECSKALIIARALAKWAEAVEYHIKLLAVKEGFTIPGFKASTRQGNRYIPDIGAAFACLNIPQEKFLEVCEVKLGKLTKLYAELNGMSPKKADTELNRKLGEIIQRLPSSTTIKTESIKE